MQKHKHYIGLIIIFLAIGSSFLLWSYVVPQKPMQSPLSNPKTTQLVQPAKKAPQSNRVTKPKQTPKKAEANNTTSTKNPRVSFGQTVVRTRQAAAVLAFARQNNLLVNEVLTLPNGDSMITLAETEQSPAVQQLQHTFSDAQVSKNFVYKTAFDFSNPDPYYENGSQWNLHKIRANKAWDLSTGTSSTTIAVIDTGVLFEQSWGAFGPFNQPDFPSEKQWRNSGEMGVTDSEGAAPNCSSRSLALDKSCNNLDDDSNGYVDDWQGWDFMGGFVGNNTCPNYSASGNSNDYIAQDNDPQPYSCDSPDLPTQLNKTHYSGDCGYDSGACAVGHGTMTASVAAAATNNGELIAGVNHQAKIMNIRVLDGYGYGSSAHVAAGIEYAVANGANVINLSLAMTDCSANFVDSSIETALASAKAAGIVVVAAAGNQGGSNVCYPASSTNAIGVGASTANDRRARFSNYGKALDVLAPGQNIPVANAPSSYHNSNYHASVNGTSFAAPHVAGLVGLIKSMDSDASFNKIRHYLISGTNRVNGMRQRAFSLSHGYGRIDAYTTLNIVRGRYPVYRLTHPNQYSNLLLKSAINIERAIHQLNYNGGRQVAFWTAPYNETGAIRVYHLHSIKNRDNIYTISSREITFLIRKGFVNKGVGFWSASRISPGSKPLYRLYHPKRKKHAFTSSLVQRVLLQKMGYRSEGIAFWVY